MPKGGLGIRLDESALPGRAPLRDMICRQRYTSNGKAVREQQICLVARESKFAFEHGRPDLALASERYAWLVVSFTKST